MFILGFLIIYANKFLIKRRKKELGLGLIAGACMKAIIYFGIIFLVVMVFNTSMISRCKLIDLLQGDKRNEKLHIKKLWVSVVVFLISLICPMLLMTIGMLSSGMGISSALTGDMEAATPYDASFTFWDVKGMEEKSMKEVLIKEGFPYDKLVKDEAEISFYSDDVTYGGVISKQTTDKNVENFIEMSLHEKIRMIRLSDYNKSRQLQGIETIVLKENEYAINCDYDVMKPQFVEKDNKGKEKIRKNVITIGVRDYYAADMPLQSVCYQTSTSLYDVGTLILPDKALTGKEAEEILLSVNYKESSANYEAMFQEANNKLFEEKTMGHYRFMSRIEVFEQGAGLRTIVTFFVLYIGIIFLITSAAVLALQQLSESSDNIERYRLLRKIGVENRMMNRSLFVQIFIYFMMPLSLAIVHSIVGIHVANQVISIFGEMNVLENIVFAGIFILLIYGGYFYATYMGSKNIIKARK